MTQAIVHNLPPTSDGSVVPYYSPSQLLLSLGYWVFKYKACTADERRLMRVGLRAGIGTSIHNGIQGSLCFNKPIDEMVRRSVLDFQFFDDSDDDLVMRDYFSDCIPDAIQQGLKCLTDEGFKNSTAETRIECSLDDVELPIMGFVDLINERNGVICEMKTKMPRKTKLLKSGEQGWAKAMLPKTEPEWNHVCQVAIYARATGMIPTICYIAPHDTKYFTPLNCDSLKAEGLDRAISQMRQRALIRQNLTKISQDAKVLASITDPDWGHQYQWNMESEWKKKAEQLWQM
jgi:hypothetical protein